MKVYREIRKPLQVIRATIAAAVRTDHPEIVAKLFDLAIEGIQAVSPAAMQQDYRRAFAFVAIINFYRTNTGNKQRRLKVYYWHFLECADLSAL